MPRKIKQQCNCIEKINACLLDQGSEAELHVSLRYGPDNPIVRITPRRINPGDKRVRCIPLLANFCPFCGKTYPWEKLDKLTETERLGEKKAPDSSKPKKKHK